MPATSHFIGLRLRSAPLADIFAALQAVLGDGVVEFQNILSAHVTLYYLPADISIDSARILSAARWLSTDIETACVGGFGYFHDASGLPTVCYLTLEDTGFVTQANSYLRQEFPAYSDVMNNTYQPYAPHATIFRIRDPERFLAKKAEIEAILARGVADIAHEDLAERVALFRVDSRLRPEMQLEIREFLDIPAADDTMRI